MKTALYSISFTHDFDPQSTLVEGCDLRTWQINLRTDAHTFEAKKLLSSWNVQLTEWADKVTHLLLLKCPTIETTVGCVFAKQQQVVVVVIQMLSDAEFEQKMEKYNSENFQNFNFNHDLDLGKYHSSKQVVVADLNKEVVDSA